MRFLAAALALAAAVAVQPALAHSDSCAAGETAVVGTTTCVNNADLEFRDWCQNSGTITSDPRRCHIVYDYMGTTQSKCAPYTHVGFFPSGPNAGKIECRNDGQTACAAREVYSAAMHACAPCPADKPLIENGACVAACSGDNLEEDGVCVASCSAGNTPSPGGTHCMSEAEARAARTCRNDYVEAERKCNIPVSPGDARTNIGCYLGGSGTPQCAEVFGADLNLPRPQQHDGLYGTRDNGYVYNCGNGATPRTVNERNTRTCFCDAGSGFSGNYPSCGCAIGRVSNADGSACEFCAGGQAESEGVCVDSCPGDEVAVDGICDAACPEGQRRVHSLVSSSFTACVPLNEARALAECENAGWSARDSDSQTIPLTGQLRCGIPSDLHGNGRNQGTCSLYENGDEITDDQRPCLKIYGDPPVYPRAEEHPNVDRGATPPGTEYFVSHCAEDKDGNAIAGGWPAGANEDGATVCGCDSESGYGGAWPNCAVCEYNEVVDGNYGACEACSVGFAHGGECVSECPSGYEGLNGGCACSGGMFLDGTACVAECPAGEYPVDGVSCSALSDAEVTTALHAEIQKDSPDTGAVRSYLRVADADGVLDGVALLITAAALGHAEVVSVLITAGADADARLASFHDLNVPLLMATYDGTQQPDGSGELARAKRLNVLRHFGDAVEVRGTVFAWNGRAGNGNHFSDLLGFSEDNEPPESDPILREMADYALTRGMHCGHHKKEDEAKRYAKYCVGTLGAALAAMIDGIDANTPAAAIRTAAQTLADAGVALLVAGDPAWGGSGVVERAAIRWNGPAVSVLITFGGDAETQGTQVRTVPHWVARNSASDPSAQLEILRHFIGGLEASGKLSGYGSWNREAQGVGRPLQTLNQFLTVAAHREAHKEDLLEIHSLMYERGSRCPAPGGGYCQVPAQTITLTARTTGTVAAVSRAPLGFRPLLSTVLSSLSVNGWSATVMADVSPPEFVVSRARVQPVRGGDAAAVFTLTMTSAAGADSRFVALSLDAVSADREALVSSVLEGEVSDARFWLATLGVSALDAQTLDDPPVPLLIAAAMRGRGEMVSVLVTFGFDPDVRNGFPPLNVPLLMAGFAGAIQADGTELPRADKWNVLRHFGDAVKVRGTLFDWNDPPSRNGHVSRYLDLSRSRESADSDSAATLLQMADYMLAQGMNCGHEGINLLHRYDAHCIGSYGAALVPLINGGHSPSDAAVRTAAQAMVDAGIPLDVAGHTENGHLIPRAAVQGHAGALSILVTFGMDPEARVGGDGTAREWQALHRIVVRLVGANDSQVSDRFLGVLRAFIGGLSVAGKLESFNGWSAAAGNGGAPLDFMQDRDENPDPYDATLEAHALLYERGARCVLPSASGRHCEVPFDEHLLPPGTRLPTGGALTMTARALSGFRSPPVAAGVSATLAANGWGFSLNTLASPSELTLSRTRPALSSDPAAVFTVTLTSALGEASREMRVSQEETPPKYDELVTAVLAGDVEKITSALESDPGLIDSNDENGVPILIVAATLGRPDVVSVLIEEGFDPEARGGGAGRTEWTALHHIADSVRDDAAGALESLRLFIGGLESGMAAKKLGSFDGWNLTADPGGRPLDVFHAAAVAGLGSAGEKEEAHALLYERGSRCSAPGDKRYCRLPFESYVSPEALAAGGVLTMTARGVAGERFASPLLDSEKTAALSAAGWGLALHANANPDEVVLSRGSNGGPDLGVAFTISLLSGGGDAIREYQVGVRPLLEYAAEAGGSLFADVASGRRVDSGRVITIAAVASVGFNFSAWQGDGGHCAAGVLECAVTVVSDVSVGASFSRDCAGENRLAGAANDACGVCLAGFGEDDGGMCFMPRVNYIGILDNGETGGGTVSSDVASGGTVAFGALVTLTATPADGHFIFEWRGAKEHCDGGVSATTGALGELTCVVPAEGAVDVRVLFRLAVRDCPAEYRLPNEDESVKDECGPCIASHEEVEEFCVPRPAEDCEAKNREDGEASYLCGDCKSGYDEEMGDLCFSETGDYGLIPQREVCAALGGRFQKNEAVCTGVDVDGTFCVLDSVDAFPCRGLFRQVLRCNLMYQRPAVNPFVCGGGCGERRAVGGGCRD